MIVPEQKFQLLQGQDQLSLYTFGTKQAKHLFCKICGVSSHYIPRSNPDGVAVTLACISAGSIESITYKNFDGQNWDVAKQASTIADCSKS